MLTIAYLFINFIAILVKCFTYFFDWQSRRSRWSESEKKKREEHSCKLFKTKNKTKLTIFFFGPFAFHCENVKIPYIILSVLLSSSFNFTRTFYFGHPASFRYYCYHSSRIKFLFPSSFPEKCSMTETVDLFYPLNYWNWLQKLLFLYFGHQVMNWLNH